MIRISDKPQVDALSIEDHMGADLRDDIAGKRDDPESAAARRGEAALISDPIPKPINGF